MSSTVPPRIRLFTDEVVVEVDVAAIQRGFLDSFGCGPQEEAVRDPYEPVELTFRAECPVLAVQEGLSLRIDLDCRSFPPPFSSSQSAWVHDTAEKN